MLRVRKRWPPHLVQCPQGLHCSYAQSTEPCPLQRILPHSRTWARAPVHRRPPLVPVCAMDLVRMRWPPLQVAEHLPQFPQALKTQSTAAPITHPASTGLPGSGPQGQDSFKAPMHEAPSPWPCSTTSRDRLFTPSQLEEQLVHSPHWPKAQSTRSHGMCMLQNLTSLAGPSGS